MRPSLSVSAPLIIHPVSTDLLDALVHGGEGAVAELGSHLPERVERLGAYQRVRVLLDGAARCVQEGGCYTEVMCVCRAA